MSAQPAATATPETADREARSRFASGNAGGPGNPFARQTAALRLALVQAIRPEQVAKPTPCPTRTSTHVRHHHDGA